MGTHLNVGCPETLTIAEVNQHSNVYLVSEEFNEEDSKNKVYKNWEFYFENELFDWYTNEDLWPNNRSLKMFKEWFDVNVHSMLFDLADDDIEKEEM